MYSPTSEERRSRRSLISGPLLIRNSIFNLAGHGLPLVVALVAIPQIISGMGTARFGLLTLAWSFIGYFSLFDMGVNRALINLVAGEIGNRNKAAVPDMVWTALILMALLGAVAAAIGLLILPRLIFHWMKISPELQPDAFRSFLILAAAVPVVISSNGLRGVLEAHQRFDLVLKIRLPLGIYNFLAPWIMVQFTTQLCWVVCALVAGRMVIWGVELAGCLSVLKPIPRMPRFQVSFARRLFQSGSWMAVSNLINPLLIYLDRFLVGLFIPVAFIAFYTTPYEAVSRILIIPGAVAGVLFPSFSTLSASERARAGEIIQHAFTIVHLLMVPVCLALVVWADKILALWLGDTFAQNSTQILRFFGFGILINSLAQLAFAMVQGAGRADLTAKVHLIELPLYILTMYGCLNRFGLFGAVLAWDLKALADGIVLIWMAGNLFDHSLRRLAAHIASTILILALSLWTASRFPADGERLLLFVGMGCSYLFIFWRYLLIDQERERCLALWRRLPGIRNDLRNPGVNR